jgi:hypothetical protein
MRSVLKNSFSKKDTVVNTSYFAGALVTATSVLVPIAGQRGIPTRGPANPYPSSMPGVCTSAR